MNVADRILGCLIGGVIGDAFGAAFEGQSLDSIEHFAADRPWYLTDDSQLTLATCEAILEAGAPDPATIAANFLKWFRARWLSGLGASTLKSLRDLDAGAHWALAGRKGERGAGNGAAMRIAPLAFCIDPATESGRRLIRDVCRITHHNDEAYIGALAIMLAIRAAWNNQNLAMDEIALGLPETSVRDRLIEYANPIPASLSEAASRFGVSGYVVESIPFALFASAQIPILGFAATLEQVVRAGGDTDTNASLTGQIAGTKLGFDAIPSDWIARIPQAEMVLATARRFADFAAHLLARGAAQTVFAAKLP